MNPKVDFFFNKAKQWQSEYAKLRTIIAECSLKEELKWVCPCYTWNKHNILLIHGFKDYCALLFMKGALLQDSQSILIQQTENVQSARQMRFTDIREILELQNAIKEYIMEAIEIEKAGLKVAFKKPEEFKMALEFKRKLEAIPELKKSFESLTPGRQRAYLLYFSSAKQSITREQRVEKCIPQILHGKGLND